MTPFAKRPLLPLLRQSARANALSGADRLLWARATHLTCIRRGRMHLFIMSIRTNGNASCKGDVKIADFTQIHDELNEFVNFCPLDL